MFFCDTGVGLIEPFWSQLVVDEAVKNICEDSKDEVIDKVKARFENMNAQYTYALIDNYEALEEVDGVHHKDQLVAKAAIYNDCDFLITNNLKHFKNAVKLQAKPRALTADSILTAMAKKYQDESLTATVLAWWHRRDSSTFTFAEYLEFLKRKTKGLSLHNFVSEIGKIIQSKSKEPNVIAEEIKSFETRRY
jgi:hypothetical protein